MSKFPVGTRVVFNYYGMKMRGTVSAAQSQQIRWINCDDGRTRWVHVESLRAELPEQSTSDVPEGWKLEHTGGNCTAWVRAHKRWAWYLTQDSRAPEDASSRCWLTLVDAYEAPIIEMRFANYPAALQWLDNMMEVFL